MNLLGPATRRATAQLELLGPEKWWLGGRQQAKVGPTLHSSLVADFLLSHKKTDSNPRTLKTHGVSQTWDNIGFED